MRAAGRRRLPLSRRSSTTDSGSTISVSRSGWRDLGPVACEASNRWTASHEAVAAEQARQQSLRRGANTMGPSSAGFGSSPSRVTRAI